MWRKIERIFLNVADDSVESIEVKVDVLPRIPLGRQARQSKKGRNEQWRIFCSSKSRNFDLKDCPFHEKRPQEVSELHKTTEEQ